MALRRFFGGPGGAAAPSAPGAPGGASLDARDTETVRRIAGQLDALPVDRARFLAAFAYILTRAAAADMEISGSETRAIEQLVAEHGKLPEAQAVLVAQIARNQSLLAGATEDYLVTRQFRELSTEEDRLALLRCCYLVGAADDTITAQESDTLQQIAHELDVDRDAVNRIRNEFAPKLAATISAPDGWRGGFRRPILGVVRDRLAALSTEPSGAGGPLDSSNVVAPRRRVLRARAHRRNPARHLEATDRLADDGARRRCGRGRDLAP